MVGIGTDHNDNDDSRLQVNLHVLRPPKSLSIYMYTEMSSLLPSLSSSSSSFLSFFSFVGGTKQKQKRSNLPPAGLPLSPRENDDNDDEYNNDDDDDSFVSIPDMAYLPGDIVDSNGQQQQVTVSKPILHETSNNGMQLPKQQQQKTATATSTNLVTLADVIAEVLRVILYIVALKNSLLGGPKQGNGNNNHHHYHQHFNSSNVNSNRYEEKLSK